MVSDLCKQAIRPNQLKRLQYITFYDGRTLKSEKDIFVIEFPNSGKHDESEKPCYITEPIF